MATPSAKVRWRRLLIADARIERGIGKVHREVDEDDRRRHEERDALHDGQVARADGAEREPPEPGQREDGFQHDRARDELTELDAHDGDDGNHRVAQRDDSHRHRHRSEEHTSELQSLAYLVCRLLLEKKKKISSKYVTTFHMQY